VVFVEYTVLLGTVALATGLAFHGLGVPLVQSFYLTKLFILLVYYWGGCRLRAALLCLLACSAGCSSWHQCSRLEITSRNPANLQQWMQYHDAQYSILGTDPLTAEWQYTRCFPADVIAGDFQVNCVEESQVGRVERIACQ
jgi:hypothetical protein